MRRWAAPLAILIIALSGALWYQQQLSRSRTGFPAPDFAVRDLRGNQYRLSQFRGKVVLLNIWATWCPPCRMEMPSMERLYRQMRGKDFVVLAVSVDEGGPALVQAFVDEFGLTFPVLLDPSGEIGQKFGITGYPETFIIDKNGTVLIHHVGYQDWGDDQVLTLLSQLIDARRDGAAAGG